MPVFHSSILTSLLKKDSYQGEVRMITGSICAAGLGHAFLVLYHVDSNFNYEFTCIKYNDHRTNFVS